MDTRFEQMERILNDLQRLEALERTQLVDSPVEEAFDRLTRFAAEITNAPVSLISLVEANRQFFKSLCGLPEPWASRRATPLSHSFCKHVVATSEPLIIEDAREHSLVHDNPAITDLNVISYLGIPLMSSDGWGFGSFCIIDHKPRIWTQTEIEIMQALATSVTTEIQLRLEMQAKEMAYALLNEKNKELDAFSHTVSHNLKNSIGSIIGWASMARRYADQMSTDELLETITVIEEAGHQATEIINALLLLSRVERAEEIELTPVNMLKVIQNALSRLDQMIAESNAVVILPEHLPSCAGYPAWIEEIWLNYITNAIKYGGRPPAIEFGAEKRDAAVRYWIKDNGKGLTETEQAHLFVAFTRLPQTAHEEGHGLGLSIVYRIATKLNGEVGVESTIGEGSVFSVTLPSDTTLW